MSRAASARFGVPPQSRVPRRVSGIRPLVLTLALAAAGAASPAFSLSLGGIAEQSMLGEPLRVAIPVSSLAGEEMSIDCVRIAPSAAPSRDDIPEISSAAVTLEQAGGQTRLVVSTRRAITDPAVRLTLQIECPETVRREYLMLLDPPSPLPTPELEASSAPPVPAVPPVRTNVATLSKPSESAPAAAAPARMEPAREARNVQRRQAQPKEPSTGAATAAAGKSPPRSPPIARKNDGARNDTPRLAVSRSVAVPEAGRGAGLDRLPKSAQLAAVEEEEVVLRKRVEELQLTVERMQQERITILAAEVERLQSELRASESARRAAENVVRTSPLHAIAQWSTDSWPLVLAALAVVGLAGGGIFAWRHRHLQQSRLPAEAPLMSHPDTGLVDTYLDEMSQFPRSFRSATHGSGHAFGPETAPPAPHEQEFERDVGAAGGAQVAHDANTSESAAEEPSSGGAKAQIRRA